MIMKVAEALTLKTPMTMKRMVMTLAGIALLTACSNEDVLQNLTSVQEGRQVTVTATLPNETPNSRVTLTEDNTDVNAPVVKVAWNESGETFSVMTATSAAQTFTQTEGTTFGGTLPDGDAPYYAFYPATATSANATAVPYDLTAQDGTLNQDYAYMYATGTDGTEYNFNHLTAIVKFTLSGMESVTPQTVSIMSDELAAKGTMDLTTLTYAANANSITITTSSNVFYAYVSPMEAMDADKNTLYVVASTADGKVYKGSLETAKAVEAGKFYTATVSMTEAAGANFVAVDANNRLSDALDGSSAGSVTELIVAGTPTADDFSYIRNSMTSLETIDLSHTELTTLPYPSVGYNPTTASGNAALETVILPESLEKIDQYVFYGCSSLKEINLPEGLTEIGMAAFYQCTGLESVSIPGTVKSIGNGAFLGCSSLETVGIGQGVETIGQEAFLYCSSLQEVTIPSSVTTVGASAFYMCTALTSATIEADLTEIPEMMFYVCTNLESVDLPETITSIGADAFCVTNIGGSLDIPSGVKYIGARAFSGAPITSVSFPEGLEEIAEAAFAQCTSLTDPIVLPSTLKKMNDGVFSDNTTSITFKGVTPPEMTLTYSADENPVPQAPDVSWMANCAVYVPAEAIDTYKASEWFAGHNRYGQQKSYFSESNLQAITTD